MHLLRGVFIVTIEDPLILLIGGTFIDTIVAIDTIETIGGGGILGELGTI